MLSEKSEMLHMILFYFFQVKTTHAKMCFMLFHLNQPVLLKSKIWLHYTNKTTINI